MPTKERACSTDLIDRAVDRWVDEGLVVGTDWAGRPLLHTPLPDGPGIWFDEPAVERVLQFFLLLKQLIGRWAGREFRLLDWQVRWLIAPVFGLKHPDGRRIIRTGSRSLARTAKAPSARGWPCTC